MIKEYPISIRQLATLQLASRFLKVGVFGVMVSLVVSGCDWSEVAKLESLTPDLATIQTEVFEPGCVQCHNASYAAGGLSLEDAEASQDGLVEVFATNRIAAENGWLRVKPGSPDKSFLVRKIEEPGMGEGAPMPPGNHALNPYYIILIRDWISRLPQEKE